MKRHFIQQILNRSPKFVETVAIYIIAALVIIELHRNHNKD